MLTSQAWRRLAHKTSTLGLASTLIAFVGSVFILSTPTAASADVTKQFSYTCSNGPFTNPTLQVGLSAPDSVTAGQTFELKVNIPTLTLTDGPQTATTVQATLALTPTGGTVTDTGPKTGAQVPANTTDVQASSVVYKVSVAAATTSKVSVRPGELRLALANASTVATTCTPSSTTEVLDVPIGTGGGGNNGDEVVTYNCNLSPDTASDPEDDYPAEVDIRVAMTTPTNATANADAQITWTNTIETGSDPLPIPTGFPTGTPKIFATVKASGAGSPASASGEASLTGVTGNEIRTISSVTVKLKPTSTGTVTLTPGDLVFGAATTGTTTAPAIKCTAPTTNLPTFTFQVAAATSSPTPTNTTPTPTNTTPTPTGTRTSTATVTVTPTSRRTSQTPKAGADTGGGGMMGPDGRMFILTGTVLIGAAAAGGLIMRRRSIRG
ncbi:hypothetical protein ABGB18_41810 [Nonomuraea sp. B12E4]|uniref:hypothetical protein n=1 Tax=Nonomuraea sp. B12E4 TaxID=3153564 RepID=UPI00325EAE58